MLTIRFFSAVSYPVDEVPASTGDLERLINKQIETAEKRDAIGKPVSAVLADYGYSTNEGGYRATVMVCFM